jgi:aspartyl-tRNA(Asn)/glutamyl-tRNA(Gln) amidotransferase subunit C
MVGIAVVQLLETAEQELCMSVDAATVKRIGRLARIRIEDAEVEKYQDELNVILGFVEQLSEVNVEGVEPMTSVTPMQLRRREDRVTDGGYPEKIVANAPLSEDNFFMVPKVIE